MSARRGALIVLGAAAAAVVLVVALAGGGEPYRLQLALDNANGLREGSEVRIGDVTAGEVSSLALGADDVVAELELDSDQAPVGKDASIAISSLNLLGQKYVALDKGDASRPAPSGFTIPRSRIGTSTDLDQVLAVLDADTRARLAILINEAGRAITGRRADLNTLLRELPDTAVAGTRLLEELIGDNRTLGDLVDRSDEFIARIADERRDVARMLDTLGQTAKTVSARRAELRQTLARAPRLLRTLQDFLGDLRSTTEPLGPAARNIAATAPALRSALAELEPFRRAANPALIEARRAAPALTRLAEGATPVLKRANPTARSLASFGRELVPVTDTLDRSIENLLAIVHNWSAAIQFRDGLSHVFNGQAVVTPETFLSMVRRLQGPESDTKRPERSSGPERERSGNPASKLGGKLPRISLPEGAMRKPGAALDEILGDGSRRLPGSPSRRDQGSRDVSTLLDFLLGP